MAPSRFKIAEYWSKERQSFVPDLGEPSCFACGYYSEDWILKSTLEALWAKTSLERAHIVADSIGGSGSSPKNFLLLCHTCHKEAPMTNSPDILTEWALHREPFLESTIKALEKELKKYLDLPQYSKIFESLSDFDSKFQKYLKHRKFDLHAHVASSSGLASRASAYAPCIAEFLKLAEVFEPKRDSSSG